jgi:hypothetical protein
VFDVLLFLLSGGLGGLAVWLWRWVSDRRKEDLAFRRSLVGANLAEDSDEYDTGFHVRDGERSIQNSVEEIQRRIDDTCRTRDFPIVRRMGGGRHHLPEGF